MSRCTILSTKILPPGFHSSLPANVDLKEAEFISIQPLPLSLIQKEISRLALPSEKLSVVFTSAHAVVDVNELLLKEDPQKPEIEVYCLGGATLEMVKEKLADIRIAGEAENAAALAKKIIAESVREVIFFCGNKRRDELPVLLEEQGVKVDEVVVYRTELQPVKVSGKFDAVLFFSPSGVESFFSSNTLAAEAVCIAIGDTTASAISAYAANKTIKCEQPTKNCMLAAIKEFTSKKKTNNDIEK